MAFDTPCEISDEGVVECEFCDQSVYACDDIDEKHPPTPELHRLKLGCVCGCFAGYEVPTTAMFSFTDSEGNYQEVKSFNYSCCCPNDDTQLSAAPGAHSAMWHLAVAVLSAVFIGGMLTH